MQPTPSCSAPACWRWLRVLGFAVRHVICGFYLFFFPVMLPSEIPNSSQTRLWERVSYCLETSPSRLPPQDASPSLTLLSLFLSFIFCPTSFWRQRAAFLGAWCPLPMFRSCFVEFAQRSNDLSMNLSGRRWSPRPVPLPSWDHLPPPISSNTVNMISFHCFVNILQQLLWIFSFLSPISGSPQRQLLWPAFFPVYGSHVPVSLCVL